MATTYKREQICLTKEMHLQLEKLKELTGESTTQIISRSLNQLYNDRWYQETILKPEILSNKEKQK